MQKSPLLHNEGLGRPGSTWFDLGRGWLLLDADEDRWSSVSGEGLSYRLHFRRLCLNVLYFYQLSCSKIYFLDISLKLSKENFILWKPKSSLSCTLIVL